MQPQNDPFAQSNDIDYRNENESVETPNVNNNNSADNDVSSVSDVNQSHNNDSVDGNDQQAGHTEKVVRGFSSFLNSENASFICSLFNYYRDENYGSNVVYFFIVIFWIIFCRIWVVNLCRSIQAMRTLPASNQLRFQWARLTHQQMLLYRMHNQIVPIWLLTRNSESNINILKIHM